MKPLRYRQVHLDFHTSECIPGVGSKFDKKQFQEALKLGHVDSITLFARCHHGWNYFDSKTGERHPSLDFDLLDAEIEAAHEIGVATPIYLTAGWDERFARDHMDCLQKPSPDYGPDFVNFKSWHYLCYNTPYMDYIVAQVEEVMQRYNPEGLFLDISFPRVCYCQHCLKSMREKGYDVHNINDVKKQAEDVYNTYCQRVEAAVRKYNPDTKIFHNMDKITRGRRDQTDYQTHLEIESLPTGGWGYDYFPMAASYARTLGKDYLGMTGKFHLAWGEFGGFKHPNALRYEASLSLSVGSKCSIGDQLHPNGEMNLSTYRLIGAAYAEVEKKEPFVRDAAFFADVAVLSAQAFVENPQRDCTFDTGVCRMLLEGKYTFNLVDQYEDFTKYKLVILPDIIRVDGELKAKLDAYLAAGGKLLCSCKSGLYADRDEFAFDFGVKDLGANACRPNYLIPEYEALNGKTPYVMYCEFAETRNLELTDGKEMAIMEESYFNRSPEHFCSHMHTPNKPGADRPGAAVKGNLGYIAWPVFSEYAARGSYHVKELALAVLRELLPDSERVINVNLPDRGVVTFTEQKKENRLVAHLLFAHTTKRGSGVEIIEDILPLYHTNVDAAVPSKPKRVYKAEYVGGAEDGKIVETDLAFTYENGRVRAEVDRMELHAMVVIDL